jgi:hypothetical protein
VDLFHPCNLRSNQSAGSFSEATPRADNAFEGIVCHILRNPGRMDSGLCIHKVWNRLARELYHLWQVDDIQWSGAGIVVDYRTRGGIPLSLCLLSPGSP